MVGNRFEEVLFVSEECGLGKAHGAQVQQIADHIGVRYYQLLLLLGERGEKGIRPDLLLGFLEHRNPSHKLLGVDSLNSLLILLLQIILVGSKHHCVLVYLGEESDVEGNAEDDPHD